MENPSADEEDPNNNRLERLPPGAEQANGQESLRAALAITQGVHRANPALSPAIDLHPDEVGLADYGIKWHEAQALYQWALAVDLLLNADDFTRKWLESGSIEGGEHQVFSDSGIAYKRNNLAFHTSYFEYFERLFMHNWLFPDTMYRLDGFMLVHEADDEFPQLRPVVSQKALRAVRGANRDEVEAEMNRMGFIRRYEDNYVNLSQTIFIEDLHDQNVLVDNAGDLLIFDPVIYLAALEQ